MAEPTGRAGCWARGETHCDRCELLDGLQVIDVAEDANAQRARRRQVCLRRATRHRPVETGNVDPIPSGGRHRPRSRRTSGSPA